MVCAAISISGAPPLLTSVSIAHGGAAAEQRFELAFVVIDGIQRMDARHADRLSAAPG